MYLFPCDMLFFFYQANLTELPQSIFIPRKQGLKFIHFVTYLLHFNILTEFKTLLCILKIVAEITSDLIKDNCVFPESKYTFDRIKFTTTVLAVCD